MSREISPKSENESAVKNTTPDRERRKELLNCASNLQGIARLMNSTTADGDPLDAQAVIGMATLLDCFAERLIRVNEKLDGGSRTL